MEQVNFAVFGGRKSFVVSLKDAAKVIGVDESGRFGNFGYGQVLLQQQTLCALDSIVVQIPDRRNAHLFGETLMHIGNRKMNKVCKGTFGNGFGVMLLNIIADPNHVLTDLQCPTARSVL